MSEKTDHPASSHIAFPYYFSDVDGIFFQGITGYVGDLFIYYTDTAFLDCKCTNWVVNDYSVTVETWLTKTQLQTLCGEIEPGAVKSINQPLDRPYYFDQTWTDDNTIIFKPNIYNKKVGPDGWEGDNLSNLINVRDEITVYPKNITTSNIQDTNWIYVKIECMISGGKL